MKQAVQPKPRSAFLSERRTGPALTAPDKAGCDVDPALGTLSWSSFSRILEENRAQGLADVLLMIDLSEACRCVLGSDGDIYSDVLPLMAAALLQAIRYSDLISHIGEYRFAVLLRGAPQDIAKDAAVRMHQSIANTVFMIRAGIVPVAIAIGGTRLDPIHRNETSVLDRAAANLAVACEAQSETVIA